MVERFKACRVERQTLTGLAAKWIPTITTRSPGLDFPPMSTSDKDDSLQKVFDKKISP